MNTIQELFQQAQLAEAAYANFSNPTVSTEDALKDSNNGGGFSQAQAAEFVLHWRVVSQQPDTANGFSATVFQNIDTGQYSFSVRGSTPAQFGTDFFIDANTIATDGIAVRQVVDMYNYWQRLTHLGVYQAATLTYMTAASDVLILLGAGVGGTSWVDAALQYLGINVTFDPLSTPYEAARKYFLDQGYVVEGDKIYQLSLDLSPNVFTDSRQWGDNTLAGQSVNVDGHSLGGHLAMAFSRLFPDATNSATAVNGLGFKIADQNVDNLFAQLGGASGFDAGKIDNVYGTAGLEFAAMNNGVLQQPGGWDGIYIESAGVGVALGHDAGQMTDSLAVYNLFAQLDPSLNTATNGLQTITGILEAETNIAANTLESAMTALGKLFNVPSAIVTGNAFDTDRNKLYNAIDGFNSIINCAVPPTIKSLVGMSAADLALNAQTDVAYRYALVNANPFVAAGMSYSGFDTHGELDLYSAATGIGNLTDQYIKDRAAYLAELIRYNTVDGLSSTLRDTRYHDLATKTTLTPINAELNRVTSISPASNDECIAHHRQYGRRAA